MSALGIIQRFAPRGVLAFVGALGRPLRTVLKWQVYVTFGLALIAGFLWGVHGVASTLLGGLVNFTAGLAYGWMVSRGKGAAAADALRTMIRAEGVKILLIVVQLWLVLSLYKDLVVPGFLFAFVATVLTFAAAFAVRDD
jgi:ATP synthase protein I